MVYDGVDGGIEIEEHPGDVEQLLVHCVVHLVCEPVNSDKRVKLENYDFVVSLKV